MHWVQSLAVFDQTIYWAAILNTILFFLKMLNDARVASARFFNGNIFPTRISKEKKF